MHPLNVVFWILFGVAAAFIAWSFLRMFFELLRGRRPPREISRAPGPGDAGVLGGTAAGGLSAGDTGTPLSGSDYGSSGDVASGDSVGGSDSGGGDFSGGGGEYGGGGSTGGW